MTDNEKIARWAGLDSHTCDENAFHCDDCRRGSIHTPDYSTDAEAVELLNVLVEKEYSPILNHDVSEWFVAVWNKEVTAKLVQEFGRTIHEAITRAVLQVIEMEAQDERF